MCRELLEWHKILSSYFDYEQAVLLRLWLSRVSMIRKIASPRVKLGFVLEKKVTATSITKSDNRVEFAMGFSDEFLRTSLMTVWELIKPS